MATHSADMMKTSSQVVSDIRKDLKKDMKADISPAGCGGTPCEAQDATQEAQIIPTVPVKKKKKVAIVGCADSKDEAPFADKSFEIWGVNNLFYHIPRWNRWFEIHTITKDANGEFMRRWVYDFRGQPVKQYLADLAKMPVPVMMQKTWPEIPNSRAYPLKEITDAYGRYFTNTISYQLALAIYEGYEVIHVYGVDMAVGSEWTHQRASCEYFLGIIKGMGRELYIPPTADLLKTRFMYAFEEKEIDDWMRKVNKMRQSMFGRMQEQQAVVEKGNKKIQQYIGAIEATNEIDKIWSEVRETQPMSQRSKE